MTKDDLKGFHKEIIERLAVIETETKGTHEQSKTTNGRIYKLEKNQSRILMALVLAFGLIIGSGNTIFTTVLGLII